MLVAIVDSGVAVNLDGGIGFVDVNRHRAGARLVVVVTGETPSGCSTRDESEAAAEIQQTTEILAFDARGSASGAVRIAIIGSGVAVDLESGLGLIDDDGSRSCCRLIVGVAVEGPVGCAAGNVGKAVAEMD